MTFFSTDEILLARVMADRMACFMHSAGVIMGGKGFLLGYLCGKSTTVKLLKIRPKYYAMIETSLGFGLAASSRRNMVPWRNPTVSASSAQLNALFFLKKSDKNRIIPITDRDIILQGLMACLIKPFITAEWWQKMITLLEELAKCIPCYLMEFDGSGEIVREIEKLSIHSSEKIVVK